MNNSIETKLMEWKNEIEEKKAEMQRAQGTMDALLKQAKEDFNCTTIEAIEKRITSLETSTDKLEAQLESKVKEYEESYADA